MIQKGDFVKISYTGYLKEDMSVFDTTDKEVAKKNELSLKHKYTPIIICVGQHQLVKGLDEFLIGKEIGKNLRVELSAEDAFGKKNMKLMKLMPTKQFTKENIKPVAGLPVNIDGMYGVVRTVAGGRTIVDFNHPLAGKEVIYEVTPISIVEDIAEKVKTLFTLEFKIPEDSVDVRFSDGTAVIKSPLKVPDEISNIFKSKLLELVPEIKNLIIETKSEASASAKTAPKDKDDKGNTKVETSQTDKEQALKE